MSVRVKICGITNAADAAAAVEAGADALGFMFFENSKRNVSFATTAAIIRQVPAAVSKVGVFVNATEDFIRRAIDEADINMLQLHGEETPEFCARFDPLPVMKAFRIRDHDSLRDCLNYRDHIWLLDSHVNGAHGGTGVAFNWDVAVEAVKLNPRVMLAGGLKVETVADAVRRVRPYGVDVSSGVELAPGKKDYAKVRDFIATARAAAD